VTGRDISLALVLFLWGCAPASTGLSAAPTASTVPTPTSSPVDPSVVAGCAPGVTTAIDGWITWAGRPVAGAQVELRSYEPSGADGRLFSTTTTSADGYFYLTGVDARVRQDVVFVQSGEYIGERKHVDMQKTCTVAHFGASPQSFPIEKEIPGVSIAYDATIASAAFTLTWDPVPPATRYCVFLISLPQGHLMVPNDCRGGQVGANAGADTHFLVPALPSGMYQLQLSGLIDGTRGSVASAFVVFNVR
jgi:hypothetical protein